MQDPRDRMTYAPSPLSEAGNMSDCSSSFFFKLYKWTTP